MRKLALLAPLLLLGCLDRLILDGTIKGTRTAASSFSTLTDLEVAKAAAAGGLAQAEGMHQLAPDNQDALFLLLSSWTGYAGAFIEDGWEQAYDRGDEDTEAREAERARQAYDRALDYGGQLMEMKKPGFKASMKNYDTVTTYLKGFEKADADILLWMGAAWLSRGAVAAERPEIVAELFVGVALAERSVELDPTLAYGLGMSMLGAYHARSPDAELAQAKELFEKAAALSGRKALTNQVLWASSYACSKRDAKLYKDLLNEVIEAGDPLPDARLENTLARRKAQRYLGKPRLQRCGF